MIKKEPEFISLKEAAQLSGYSADYIGQLIRSGKLQGKQVFSNVAWMTTRDAIAEYLKKDSKSDEAPKSFIHSVRSSLFTMETVKSIYVAFVWLLLSVLLIFTVFLAYVLAVSIDNRIEESHLDKVQYAQE